MVNAPKTIVIGAQAFEILNFEVSTPGRQEEGARCMWFAVWLTDLLRWPFCEQPIHCLTVLSARQRCVWGSKWAFDSISLHPPAQVRLSRPIPPSDEHLRRSVRQQRLSLWSDWESLGGALQGDVGVCAWAHERLDVFAQGTNNELLHKWYEFNGWSDWESLGGTRIGDPAAVSWVENRIDVVARGTDSAIWHKYWDGVWKP
ncbi:MAG: DUF346 domain-containing protein [Anaerolineae bacterium]|nr:DUF346 domain-containing protein [Anaerolineae bacterium]